MHFHLAHCQKSRLCIYCIYVYTYLYVLDPCDLVQVTSCLKLCDRIIRINFLLGKLKHKPIHSLELSFQAFGGGLDNESRPLSRCESYPQPNYETKSLNGVTSAHAPKHDVARIDGNGCLTGKIGTKTCRIL